MIEAEIFLDVAEETGLRLVEIEGGRGGQTSRALATPLPGCGGLLFASHANGGLSLYGTDAGEGGGPAELRRYELQFQMVAVAGAPPPPPPQRVGRRLGCLEALPGGEVLFSVHLSNQVNRNNLWAL